MAGQLTDRRKFVALAMTTGLLPIAAAAQGSPTSQFDGIDPLNAGDLHNKALDVIDEVLKGTAASSRKGFSLLLELLVKSQIIDEKDLKDLEQMFDVLFAAKNYTDILDGLASALKSIAARGKSPAAAIASIALSSARRAKRVIEQLGTDGVKKIIRKDVSGAMTALGSLSWFLPKNPYLLAFVAACGAVPDSNDEYDELAKTFH
jgi:hypothetical protein